MGIRGDSALVPWRPFFWNDAEVVLLLLQWPPPGGLPQRPDVRRLEGRQELYIYYASACAYYYDGGLLRAARLSKPFAFAALKTGIALVCTSSTSAPELAAVLL